MSGQPPQELFREEKTTEELRDELSGGIYSYRLSPIPESLLNPRFGREPTRDPHPLDHNILSREQEQLLFTRLEEGKTHHLSVLAQDPLIFEKLSRQLIDQDDLIIKRYLVNTKKTKDGEHRIYSFKRNLQALCDNLSGTANASTRELEEIGAFLNPKEFTYSFVKISYHLLENILNGTSAEENELKNKLSGVWQSATPAYERVRDVTSLLVQYNRRSIEKVANKICSESMPNEELRRYGEDGLLIAIDKFDHHRQYRLSTFSTWWIRQEMLQALERSGTIRIPANKQEEIRRLLKARAHTGSRLNNKIDIEEVAKDAKMTLEGIRKLELLENVVVSLDAPVSEEGNATLGEYVPDIATANPEYCCIQDDAKEILESLFQDLKAENPRQARVLALRYGLFGEDEHTLDEIGRELDVTRERARQIESRALRVLRSRRFRTQLQSLRGQRVKR